MEGRVTISLKDYENLKENGKWHKYYLDIAVKQIKLLETVEGYLRATGTTHIIKEMVEESLNNWYG